MVVLASVVAFALALALGVEGRASAEAGPGALWVSGLLAGALGMGRLVERERVLGGFSALLLAPVSRTAVFLGKSTVLLLMLLLTYAALIPLVALLYRVDLWGHLPGLALLVVGGASGHALAATLLGAIAVRARTGELLLGALLYPLLVPVLIGAVMGTTALLEGGGFAELRPWLGLVLVSDALFLVAGLWLYEPLVAD
jgi:heme exporter protein B